MKVLLLLIGLLTGFTTCAQNGLYYNESFANAGKPYWTTQTNPQNGNTAILFFDRENQLIYREDLRGQVVKPSKRNIRKFDKMLQLMSENKLVSAQIQTLPFPVSTEILQMSSVRKTNSPGEISGGSSSLVSRVYTRKNGVLTVFLQNPKKNRIGIQLIDQKDRPVYFEDTNVLNYGRDLNISELEGVEYQLLIKYEKETEKYKLHIGLVNRYEVTRADLSRQVFSNN